MPTKAQDIDDPALRRLHALMDESPHLKDAALLYEAMLPVLQDTRHNAAPAPLTPEQAREKMRQGLPLLCGLDLDLDVDSVHETMLRLVKAVGTAWRNNHPRQWLPWGHASQGSEAAAQNIRTALENGRLDIAELLSKVCAGERTRAAAISQDLHLDPDLVWTLAQNAFKPALREWRRQLAPDVEGIPWDKGSCFVCGAAAVFGELQENDQVKHLRCGSCGADWRYPRLRCAHCANEDHRTQHYFSVEGMGDSMRVETCDACKGYLKVISSFSPTLPELLPIEDLATLSLDYIAQEKGYVKHST
jgi:FdhE protein